MTNRNTHMGSVILGLVALAAVAAFQPGYGETRDTSETRKAAERGDAGAQASLGGFYHVGYGVPQDKQEAVRWWRKAAERGDAKAQWLLGGAYAEGNGVPQDLARAYAWLNLAAAQGNKLAVAVKDKLRPKMTAKQVAEAQKLATELWDRIESSKSK